MTSPMNRRHLLAGAAAVPLLPAAAVSGQVDPKPPEPDPTVETSPVRAKFEEWKRLYAWTESTREGDEDELTRRIDILDAHERELYAMPARNMAELAMKLAAMERCEFSDHIGQKCLAEDARRILAEQGVQA